MEKTISQLVENKRDKQRFRNLVWRFYFTGALFLIVLLFLGYWVDCYVEQQKWKEREVESVYSPSIELFSYYHEPLGDLLIVADQHELFGGTAAANAKLVRVLKRIAVNRRSYYQLRFIDASGYETVRIEFQDGKVKVVAKENLQYKGRRPYFQKTIKLSAGEVFISRFDLNIEHGVMEIPRQPVVRFATPVYDPTNTKRGILIINYYGEKLLNHIKMYDNSSENKLMLLNAEGQWLYKSGSKVDWGFYEVDEEYFKIFSPIWNRISNLTQGQFFHNDTLVTYREIDVPTIAEQEWIKKYTPAGNIKLVTEERPWKIVSLVEPDVLIAQANQRIKFVGTFILLLLLLLVPASRSLAQVCLKSVIDEQRVKTYAQVVEQSADLVYITNCDGKICYTNKALNKEFEMAGIGNGEIMIPETCDCKFAGQVWRDYPELLEDIQRALIQEDFVVVRYINNRGYRIRYSPLKDRNSVFKGVVSVATDITDRLLAERLLEKSEQRLSKLALHIETAREQERAAIARDIHDELGSTLTALKIDISLMKNKLKLQNTDQLSNQLQHINSDLDNAIKKVRQVCTNLHPQIITDLGLMAAMEWQVRQFEKRSGIRCCIDLASGTDRLSELPYSHAVAVFRIVQECLTNILRHAQATSVSIKLTIGSDKRLILSIVDNGKGATQDELFNKQAFGILAMQERVRHLGGRMMIESELKKGTSITLKIPLSSKNSGASASLPGLDFDLPGLNPTLNDILSEEIQAIT